ncbi:MAG: hypothetical protein COW00_19285 [Bdellovibrio sp. CG12_big_fil_rev_8_21_14_0_65_39_13]|nr:MAG: hypothetical protein COW78_01350 [Bdellovibrio sp. CG22_combo_CG10-13_8_21_14_all_39_27]PIQ57706.1 MAG: hypothetical protein COW00_19285 [Bdellovibrio sp. CG12_big_fil_rev_8_21_14_0_65_39_13]PIR36566.1 MAG: hypothetical protein COV37_02685 [Bdellovibrio sp. CG11_big_fil_rev_8_21_14_0_20_39_38]
MFRKLFLVNVIILNFSSVYAEENQTCEQLRDSCKSDVQKFEAAGDKCACISLTPGGPGFNIERLGTWDENETSQLNITATRFSNERGPSVGAGRYVAAFDRQGAYSGLLRGLGNFQGQNCSTILPETNAENDRQRAVSAQQKVQYQLCLEDNGKKICEADHKDHVADCLRAATDARNEIMGLANIAPVDTSRGAAAAVAAQGSGQTNPSAGGVKLNGPIAFDNTSPDPLRKKKSNLTFTQHVGSPSTYGDKYGISASDVLVLCEGEAAVPWAETRGQDPEKNWGPSMNEFVASTVAKFNEKFSQPKEKSAYEQFFNTEVIPEIKLRVETYVKCQALTMMMDNSDYGDQEVENTNDKGKYIKVSALKPELKCETSYHDAQDFYACVKVLNAYDALNIAGQGMQVYQQVDNGMKLADRQTDLQKKTLTGGTIDTTDVLQQQKQTVKDAAGYAQQRAALDTAKVATLFAMLKQMPSKEDLTSQCISTEDAWTKKISESFFTRIKTSLFNALNGATFDKDFSEYKKTYVLVFQNESTFAQGLATTEQGSTGRSICNKVSVSSSSRGGGAVNLLPNQAIKEQMKGEMVKAGVDAASNMAKAALLNKQAGEIDDVINSIKSFEPPPIPEQQLTDMQILECQANPQAENCGTINGRGNVSFTGNGINVGNGQFATTDGQGIDLGNTDPTASNSATSKSDRTGMARKLGGATADAPGDGGILNPVAAAEIKKGGGNPGGGGGGGASAPGAAGGGGAGGKPGTGGGSGASSGQGLAKMKYSGSSSGSLSWSGGGGLARKPAAKVDNPFANLLGKGGGKNGVLDGFRGPASGIGKKEDGLFNMISNRYSQVANDKERLIQYEIKK